MGGSDEDRKFVGELLSYKKNKIKCDNHEQAMSVINIRKTWLALTWKTNINLI